MVRVDSTNTEAGNNTDADDEQEWPRVRDMTKRSYNPYRFDSKLGTAPVRNYFTYELVSKYSPSSG